MLCATFDDDDDVDVDVDAAIDAAADAAATAITTATTIHLSILEGIAIYFFLRYLLLRRSSY